MKKFLSDNDSLMAEYNFKKNADIEPSCISLGSNKKIWWICSKGHEWKATPNNRNRGTSCPYCSNKKVLTGFNDLATLFPEIASEWDCDRNSGLSPECVLFGSNKKAWWKCVKCGHSWQAAIYTRTKGCGCPKCSYELKNLSRNKTNLALVGSLADNYSDLCNEWNYEKNGDLTPATVSSHSNKAVWWICGKKHEWKASINSRVNGNGCPYCSNKRVLPGFNDLATLFPEIASEWDYSKNHKKPSQYSYGSGAKAWWICPCGHSYANSINHRTTGIGCPTCAIEKQTSFPEQAIFYYISKVCEAENRVRLYGKELDIFIPRLNTGIEYNGEFFHRNKEKHDKEKVIFFKNHGVRIITIRESDKQLFFGDILEYVYSADGRSLSPVIEHIFAELELPNINIDVPAEKNKILESYLADKKNNSLLVKEPYVASWWNYEKNGNLLPSMFTVGSKKKVWWKCPKGHEWESSVQVRVRGGGCPYCSNRKTLKGFNDICSTSPELLDEWCYEENSKISLFPDTLTSGSNKSVWWRCKKCGHKWRTSVWNRSAGHNCPLCSKKKDRAHE